MQYHLFPLLQIIHLVLAVIEFLSQLRNPILFLLMVCEYLTPFLLGTQTGVEIVYILLGRPIIALKASVAGRQLYLVE